MIKMNELAAEIAELRKCAETIIDVADSFTKMFGGNDEPTDAPTPEPALTLEAVRAVLADKSRNGHTAEIRSLLQKYGAAKLSEIDPANYKALLGCRVELLRMDDLQAPPVGTKGTVRYVDDIGSLGVAWDNGSSLQVVYGEDLCRKLEDADDGR